MLPLRLPCEESCKLLPFSLFVHAGWRLPEHARAQWSQASDSRPHARTRTVSSPDPALAHARLTSSSRRQIFISNNLADDEVTTLQRIQLFGQSIAPTDMKEFK